MRTGPTRTQVAVCLLMYNRSVHSCVLVHQAVGHSGEVVELPPMQVAVCLLMYNRSVHSCVLGHQAVGHTGEVVELPTRTTQGAVSARFMSSVYKFNPRALLKVSSLLERVACW